MEHLKKLFFDYINSEAYRTLGDMPEATEAGNKLEKAIEHLPNPLQNAITELCTENKYFNETQGFCYGFRYAMQLMNDCGIGAVKETVPLVHESSGDIHSQLIQLESISTKLTQASALGECICNGYFGSAKPDIHYLGLHYDTYSALFFLLDSILVDQRESLAAITEKLYETRNASKKAG